jgi:hypothetical protein
MLAALASIATTSQANAGDFTKEECAGVMAVALEVVKAAGKDTLSVEFRQSFRNWLGPNVTCDGPKDILTPTDRDIAAYNTIRTGLLLASKPISLEKAGLRSVDPKKVSAIRPDDNIRAEAEAGPQLR